MNRRTATLFLPVLFALFATPPLLAQDNNFNDLRRPGAPLVKSYTISGAGAEGSRAIRKFSATDSNRDNARNASRAAASSQQPECKYGEPCFRIAEKKDNYYIIECTTKPASGLRKELRYDAKRNEWGEPSIVSLYLIGADRDMRKAGNKACVGYAN